MTKSDIYFNFKDFKNKFLTQFFLLRNLSPHGNELDGGTLTRKSVKTPVVTGPPVIQVTIIHCVCYLQ